MTLLMIAGALIAACSEPAKPTGPRLTGRLFYLSGDKGKGSDLLELTAASNGAPAKPQVITSGVFEAVASPDQTKLLYTTKDEIMIRDFGTGSVKSLVNERSSCLAWAPDGNHFSYVERIGPVTKFYAADPEGKAKLVLEDPNGSGSCAEWISSTELVFDRFVGAPVKKNIYYYNSDGGGPKPNTTTVATVGEPVKLKDTPRKWTIESVCAKSNNGFLRSDDQGKLLIAKNIDHFESLDPAPGPCSECRFVAYAAQSCVPFFVEQPTSTTTELFYLNPANWQKQKPATINRTFSPSAKALIKSSAKSMVIGDGENLFLVDAESGAIVSLLDAPVVTSNSGIAAIPVLWIEK